MQAGGVCSGLDWCSEPKRQERLNSICQGSVFVLNAINTGEGSRGLGGWCTREMAAAPDGVSSGGGVLQEGLCSYPVLAIQKGLAVTSSSPLTASSEL